MVDQHLVVVDLDLLATEGNVQASVGAVHLAHHQAAGVVTSTHEQGLTRSRVSTLHSPVGHMTVGAGYPGVVVSHQNLVLALLVLMAIVSHVGASLAGDHLGRQVLAVVESTTDIDRGSVHIVTTSDRVMRHTGVGGGVYPVNCREIK